MSAVVMLLTKVRTDSRQYPTIIQPLPASAQPSQPGEGYVGVR
jgi:hypothetical protein